jgi:hypothetical protein
MRCCLCDETESRSKLRWRGRAAALARMRRSTNRRVESWPGVRRSGEGLRLLRLCPSAKGRHLCVCAASVVKATRRSLPGPSASRCLPVERETPAARPLWRASQPRASGAWKAEAKAALQAGQVPVAGPRRGAEGSSRPRRTGAGERRRRGGERIATTSTTLRRRPSGSSERDRIAEESGGSPSSWLVGVRLVAPLSSALAVSAPKARGCEIRAKAGRADR